MSLLNDLWELFFPRVCVLCGARLSGGEEHLCFRCLSGLPRTNMHRWKDNEMEKAFWGKLPLVHATAFLFYAKGGDVRRLLYELKYYDNPRIGHFLGRLMATEIRPSDFFQSIDGILPVPLHRKRERWRGYNQSRMLAEGISSVTGIPVLHDALVRSRYTETQTHRSSYERWMNIEDAFECPSPERLTGKHLLLIDDVFTTGATLVACADALQGCRDVRFSVLTLAIAGAD